jgi:hypothetical protein
MSFSEAQALTRIRSQFLLAYKTKKGERLEVYLTGKSLLTILNLDAEKIFTYDKSVDPKGFEMTLYTIILAGATIEPKP